MKIIIFLLFAIKNFAFAVNYGSVWVSNVEVCKPPNYIISGYEIVIKNVTGGLSMSLKSDITRPLGDDNYYSCKLYKGSKANAKLLLTIAGNGLCTAMNNYGGKLWNEVQARLGNPRPAYCPIAAGNYSMEDYVIRVSEIAIVAVIPKGLYHTQCSLFEVDKKTTIGCSNLDVTRY